MSDPQQRAQQLLATADMRIEVVKREINQGALAGLGSEISDYAAALVIAALDTFDEHLKPDDEVERLRAELAEWNTAKRHRAFSHCAQNIGHVTMAAFGEKIAEKVQERAENGRLRAELAEVTEQRDIRRQDCDDLAEQSHERLQRALKAEAEVERLLKFTATCTCDTSYETYDGPQPDCMVHGAVRALNEAHAELTRIATEIEAERDKVRGADGATIRDENVIIGIVNGLGIALRIVRGES